MTSENAQNCTLLIHQSATVASQESELVKKLENKDEAVKIEGLKEIITLLQNGETMPRMLMPVIKFSLHTENHIIKKLLLLFWEVVEKKNKDGTLLHEMILVCNSMKNNLSHANEYIRGCTLRFLCKMKEEQILESLIPSVTQNLEHRHSYVRKNAVLCVHAIYEAHPDLIPDAPELIETFLQNEANSSAKRNAFLMLFHCDQDRAVGYLSRVINTIDSTGESFQLVALELIRKVCRSNPAMKSQYVHCIYALINSKSHAVVFESANTLVSLSAANTAIRQAVTAYCGLLQSESDNNIKLVILNRITALKKRNERILQEMLMDILRTLSSPNLDIRKKTLSLALDLVSPRNVEDVVGLLKKEILKTKEISAGAKEDDYRKLLVDAMHKCAVKFPDVVQKVVHLLMNYLGDEGRSALDVVYFVREIVEEFEHLREGILAKLLDNFSQIRSVPVFHVALWIIGEYCSSPALLEVALNSVSEALGPMPLATTVAPVESDASADAVPQQPVVLADGTYASQAAATVKTISSSTVPPLRAKILEGKHYFLATALCSAVAKLNLRYTELAGLDSPEANAQRAQAMLIMTSIMRLGETGTPGKRMDKDSYQRILLCFRVLLDPKNWGDLFRCNSREAFAALLKAQRADDHPQVKEVEVLKQPDELISIRQLVGAGFADAAFIDDDESDLNKAMGSNSSSGDASKKLSRVYQLTGFADPVYGEAELTVHEYDIVLNILVVNQTKHVLQKLCVELNTSGDLKVMERPQTYTLAPFASLSFSANIKVTSTESGAIFGNIVYDSTSGTDQTIVVMNNIHMDVMDYISPAQCSDKNFRLMWAAFEWENKVAVVTDITSLTQYLDHIVAITNMRCMTSQENLDRTSTFLAANLFARSLFGEDALLNLSAEKQPGGKIVGTLRIRSKTQGIALTLGDKITAQQRGPATPTDSSAAAS